MRTIEERFIKYVKIDTQSVHDMDVVPSTEKQKDLGVVLVEELKELGLADAFMDDHGYVYATLPANEEKAGVPVIGFLAHMDTTPDYSGTNVNPRIVRYDGGDIVLNEELGIVLSPSQFPCLNEVKGHELIVTDGTTLLGADDKAGVADIMDMLDYFYEHPEVKHGTIKVAFTPDEEVGNGPKFFDVKGFGADFAYTLDGGQLGNVCYETFNACDAKIYVKGLQTHPGVAKDKMKNSIMIAMELDLMLPKLEVPEHTEGFEGYHHLTDATGTISNTYFKYIIRDHDKTLFEQKKAQIRKAAEFLNRKYGEGTVTVDIQDTYYNMKYVLGDYAHCVDTAMEVIREFGVEPKIVAVRGGTDGSQLSYMGLPCPNLHDGGYIAHSKYEFASLTEMRVISQTLAKLVCRYFERA